MLYLVIITSITCYGELCIALGDKGKLLNALVRHKVKNVTANSYKVAVSYKIECLLSVIEVINCMVNVLNNCRVGIHSAVIGIIIVINHVSTI